MAPAQGEEEEGMGRKELKKLCGIWNLGRPIFRPVERKSERHSVTEKLQQIM